MLLHMLGGGPGQIKTVRRIRELGHQVLVSDYYPDAPAKKYANYSTNVSTFDREGILAVSREYKIDGILTAGTDQPVLTAAETAAAMGLPSFITPETALAVTNKRVMKPLMEKAGIPANSFILIAPDDEHIGSLIDRVGLSYPLVIKPVDSQGQRGVVRVDSEQNLVQAAQYAARFTRDSVILAEEYYPSDEITVSGWVCSGTVKLFSITDRITLDNLPHIGVCHAHRYPSCYHVTYREEIAAVTQAIADGFSINSGPIYIQMLIGLQGIRVNEVACRIGGAYEDEAIPRLTGISITDLLIAGTMGDTAGASSLIPDDADLFSDLCAVLLLFAKPCSSVLVSPFSYLAKLPGVCCGAYHLTDGAPTGDQENATQRAGYVVITAESADSLEKRVQTVYDQVGLTGVDGSPLVIRLPGEFFSCQNRNLQKNTASSCIASS
jgi:biotin carboxylase